MLGAGRDVTQLFDSYHKLEIVKFVTMQLLLILDKTKTDNGSIEQYIEEILCW